MSKLELAPYSISHIIKGTRSLQLTWNDGHVSTYHYIWLRDNSPQSRDAWGQRAHTIHDIYEEIPPWSVKLANEGGLEILWAQAEHRSFYPAKWLRAHCYSDQFHTLYSLSDSEYRRTEAELWSGRVVSKPMVSMSFDEVARHPARCRDWVDLLKRFGIGILKNVGRDVADFDGVVQLLGVPGTTPRGGIFDLNSVNSNEKAPKQNRGSRVSNHMLFRNPMPELQMYHCLSKVGAAGECVLVDGYFVGGLLKRKYPGMFLLLSSYPVPFIWAESGYSMIMERTIIDTNYRGEITNIHFNHRSAGPFHIPSRIMESYYEAYGTFARMLNNPSYQFPFMLEPGEVVALDNRRVLIDLPNLFFQKSPQVRGRLIQMAKPLAEW